MRHATKTGAALGGVALVLSLSLVPLNTSCGPVDPALRGPFFTEVGAGGGVVFTASSRNGDMDLLDRMDGGVCLLDANDDGQLDIFLASRQRGQSALFVGTSREPLRFENRTGAAGLTSVNDAVGCLAFDADADGDDDLLLTGVGNLQLYLQQAGSFIERNDLLSVTIPETNALVSSAAGDVDGDGDLDLVIAGFVDVTSVSASDCGGLPCGLLVDRYTGVPSYFLENQLGLFVDRTSAVMPDLMEPEPTLVVAIADLDADGSQEVLVGNDTGARFHDRLLVRSGGVFQDLAMSRALATDGAGHGVDSMGIAIGDVDGDGVLDVTQTTFEDLITPIWFCGADGVCADRGSARGTAVTSDNVRWSNALLDVDLDGDLDLFEVGGHILQFAEGRAAGISFLHTTAPYLLLQTAAGFRRTASSDALSRPLAGRGLGVGDLDDDGRLDLVIGVTEGQPVVLENQTTGGHYLRVELQGSGLNPRGIGARVEVRDAAGITRVRIVRAGEGYASTFDPRLHFGLPDAGLVDVTVRWPSGVVTTHPATAVDAALVAVETPPP